MVNHPNRSRRSRPESAVPGICAPSSLLRLHALHLDAGRGVYSAEAPREHEATWRQRYLAAYRVAAATPVAPGYDAVPELVDLLLDAAYLLTRRAAATQGQPTGAAIRAFVGVIGDARRGFRDSVLDVEADLTTDGWRLLRLDSVTLLEGLRGLPTATARAADGALFAMERQSRWETGDPALRFTWRSAHPDMLPDRFPAIV